MKNKKKKIKNKKNKIYAILLILCGIPLMLIEGDATMFVFFCIIGIPLFFSKQNWIN